MSDFAVAYQDMMDAVDDKIGKPVDRDLSNDERTERILVDLIAELAEVAKSHQKVATFATDIIKIAEQTPPSIMRGVTGDLLKFYVLPPSAKTFFDSELRMKMGESILESIRLNDQVKKMFEDSLPTLVS
jgi:hypothetical protein